MTERTARIAEKMVEYDCGDIRRIEHFIKVYGYASAIGRLAALLHDIGIKVSEEKYHSSAGKYQELEGPAEARRLLEDTGTDREMTERICWLIGHHHTYGHIQDMDHQILVEADFLVNLAEDHASDEAVRHVLKTVFRTESGIRFLKSLWSV